MPVVVSDTTPLHYLILVEKEFILEKLYAQVHIPPAVHAELSHPLAPRQIAEWASDIPGWVTVVSPQSVPGHFKELDIGEQQALALAAEMRADLILLDDKVARRAALRESMRVKGTLGIVADAARVGLIDFVDTMRKLQATSMYLDPAIVEQLIAEHRRS